MSGRWLFEILPGGSLVAMNVPIYDTLDALSHFVCTSSLAVVDNLSFKKSFSSNKTHPLIWDMFGGEERRIDV